MELSHTAQREGRLSGFLKGEMAMSTGLMNRLKWGDAIRVNGQSVHTDYHVLPGDRITVRLDEPEPEYPAQDGPISILYEDAWILAVDKPAGMLIHPSNAKNDGTLANFVVGYYAATGQKCAFHPVTRLDRDTFGIVLLAKNSHSHALLNEQHNLGQIRKTYHALVFGGPGSESGTIDAPIARKPLPSLLREVREDGKPSRTEFTVLERREKCAKLALRPVTGRTHQLRVHCAWMGFPILGDPQYAGAESAALSEEMGLATQALCAVELEFRHPISGERMKLRSNLDV